MRRLDGKVAIISGSGRGIGRELALRLAEQGASVVVNDLDAAPADEVVAAIEAIGGKALACTGDVTADDFADRFVHTALDTFGGLDIIVNNAGYTRDGVIQKQTDEQFQAMLDVHVVAPFRILRAAAEPLRRMAREEAAAGREVIRKVVNVSSMAGTHGNAGQINYSAAKSALLGMTKTMSKEWGRFKVCVNCVAFGIIDTRLTQPSEAGGAASLPAHVRDAMLAAVPLGRPGTAREAADSIYMLCAPESDYISGQTLVVSGGLSI